MVFTLAILLLSTLSFANDPPIVNAGPDTTIRLGIPEFRLQGTAQDELTWPDLSLQWTQASGPQGGAQILVRDVEQSPVMFSTIGLYSFVLTANDGQFQVSDTVRVNVLDSIPFVITSPVAGQKVRIGSEAKISWQVYPTRTPVRLDLSVNGGKSFEGLPTSSVGGDDYYWQVNRDLAPSDDCIIRAQWYFDDKRVTYSGRFSLVPEAWTPPAEREGGCGNGIGLAFGPILFLRLVSRRRRKRP